MPNIYVAAVPTLMVSRKLLRWVREVGGHVEASFESARQYAEEVLPDAVGTLGLIDPLFVFHCNALLVIIFDRRAERFCVVAYYVDESDPTPPAGPRPPAGRNPIAEGLISRLGLLDNGLRATPHPAVWSLPGTGITSTAACATAIIPVSSLAPAGQGLRIGGTRRVRDELQCAGERDSLGSRSTYFPEAPDTLAFAPPHLRREGGYQCFVWTNCSDRPLTDPRTG